MKFLRNWGQGFSDLTGLEFFYRPTRNPEGGYAPYATAGALFTANSEFGFLLSHRSLFTSHHSLPCAVGSHNGLTSPDIVILTVGHPIEPDFQELGK